MKAVKSAALSLLIAIGICSCRHAPASPNEPLAASKGREAALHAITLPLGSMQQEKALLSIRAMEYKIAQTGDTLAAKAYIRAAAAVLDSAGVISSNSVSD